MSRSPGQESVRQALAAASRAVDPDGASASLGGGGAAGSQLPRPQRVPRRDALVTLVQRITQGLDPVEVARARALGYDAYLEEQLDHLSIDDSALNARLSGLTTLPLSPRALVASYDMARDVPVRELQQATLLRALYSKRQLFERTCEFWTDHFNVHHGKGMVWAFQGQFDREVIRTYAFARMHELMAASAASPAMLFYLDNWLNHAGAPQENYARELMELHSMRSGYTEGDVHEIARCFTGWTIDFDPSSTTYLGFRFRAHLHEPGDKVLLGEIIPENPAAMNGFRVIEKLCARPETAAHVVSELIAWFLTPEPPPALVEENAQLFLEASGTIEPVLRSILARENMRWAAPVHAPKFRRPFHFMTSVLRTLHAEVSDASVLVERLGAMGHAPFDWPSPAGYPDTAEAWGSSLLPRWTFASDLLAGQVPGVQLPSSALLERLEVSGPGDRRGLAKRIDRELLGASLSLEEEALVQQLADSFTGPFGWDEVSEVVALAMSMPGYQWY
jgi:uncharacterized protein (DUF1800 family)